MCENCQKISKPDEEENGPVPLMPVFPPAVLEAAANRAVALSRIIKRVQGDVALPPPPSRGLLPPVPWDFPPREARALPTSSLSMSFADSAAALARQQPPADTIPDGGSSGSSRYGPYGATTDASGVRLGIPMARSTWSPILRLINGKPVTIAQYQAHLRARVFQATSRPAFVTTNTPSATQASTGEAYVVFPLKEDEAVAPQPVAAAGVIAIPTLSLTSTTSAAFVETDSMHHEDVSSGSAHHQRRHAEHNDAGDTDDEGDLVEALADPDSAAHPPA